MHTVAVGDHGAYVLMRIYTYYAYAKDNLVDVVFFAKVEDQVLCL